MDELRPVWAEAPRHVPDAALPPYRFIGDLHPHPREDPAGSLYGAPKAAPGLPADRWREDRSYLFGIDLYHQGYLWEAHEHWEAGFFAATDAAHRDLLQALIQLAAALIQAHRGRGSGVRYLAGRVVERLRSVAAAHERLAGIDVSGLLADIRRHFAAALDASVPDERADVTSGPPPRLVLA